MRVGTAVQVLPLSNPLRIAEDVATVDQLSEGRFDFGIGRSGSPRAYDALGIPYAESQARFLECLDIIRQARRYKSKRELTGAIRRVARADLALRSNPPSKRLVLENLILDLTAEPKLQEVGWLQDELPV